MKHFLAAIFLFLFCSEILAQEFKAGIKAGVCASQVSGDNLSGFNKGGAVFGGFANRSISQKASLQMEIIYIQKGSRKNPHPDKGDYVYYLMRLNYIEVPIILKWQYKEKLGFEIGPSFGYLFKTFEEDEVGPFTNARPFHTTEIAINFGLIYPITDNILVNWRYSNSLLPIRDHVSGATYRLNWGQYNTALEFTLQYQFR